MIVIPAIDIIDGKCVRLVQGDYSKKSEYAVEPLDVAKAWESIGAEYIHLVDLDGARKGFPCNAKSISKIVKNIKIPVEIGGGIRTIDDFKLAISTGVDRIILGTAAIENRKLVSTAVTVFGAEKVVVGIDAKDGFVAVRGWLEVSNVSALDLAQDFMKLGVSRFVYTDIARDGSLAGPNLVKIKEFSEAVSASKVIASGGVGNLKDIEDLKALSEINTNIEGVIVGKSLYDKKIEFADILKILR